MVRGQGLGPLVAAGGVELGERGEHEVVRHPVAGPRLEQVDRLVHEEPAGPAGPPVAVAQPEHVGRQRGEFGRWQVLRPPLPLHPG